MPSISICGNISWLGVMQMSCRNMRIGQYYLIYLFLPMPNFFFCLSFFYPQHLPCYCGRLTAPHTFFQNPQFSQRQVIWNNHKQATPNRIKNCNGRNTADNQGIYLSKGQLNCLVSLVLQKMAVFFLQSQHFWRPLLFHVPSSIHAKSGWYLRYITANFFGFSAKF